LVGGAILYPLGITIDFLKEIEYYHRCQRINCKASLSMRFIRWQARKSNKSIMLDGILGLPHGFEYWKVTSMIGMNPQ
jgi:hypothetical protein